MQQQSLEYYLDVDSDDPSDNGSTTSLDTENHATVEKYHRLYPAVYQDQYPWPIDETEEDRLNDQFDLYYELFHGKLYYAPFEKTWTRTVLDVRTGTGRWGMKFADTFPESLVFGIDLVGHMMSRWVPPNCQFYVEDLTRPDWCQSYKGVDMVHVGDTGGDLTLLNSILAGARRCCAASATVEVWGTRVHFTDIDGDTGLHRFYQQMKRAYSKDQRDLDLPASFTRELHRHGFVNIDEHVHIVPMNTGLSELETRILANWASGFEARSLELMNRELGMGYLHILLECTEARKAMRSDVDAFLEIRVAYGQVPSSRERR